MSSEVGAECFSPIVCGNLCIPTIWVKRGQGDAEILSDRQTA